MSELNLRRDRLLTAEIRAGQWLAEGNAAAEAGNTKRANKAYAKAQSWHDRANSLREKEEWLPYRSSAR